jgi:hypothetical protein
MDPAATSALSGLKTNDVTSSQLTTRKTLLPSFKENQRTLLSEVTLTIVSVFSLKLQITLLSESYSCLFGDTYGDDTASSDRSRFITTTTTDLGFLLSLLESFLITNRP